MSISISNFSVTAETDGITEESDFYGVFIQGISGIIIKANIASTSGKLSQVKLLLNDVVFDSRDINISSYEYENGFMIKEAYIGQKLDIEIKIIVIDQYGNMRQSQAENITVYPYSKPKLIPLQDMPSISVFRGNNDGSQNDTGTRAVISAKMKAQTSLNRTALTPQVKIRYKVLSDPWPDPESWTDISLSDNTNIVLADTFSKDSVYNIQLKVEDEICSSEIYKFSLPSESTIYDAAPGGRKYAFGGSARSLPDDTFAVYWKTKLLNELDVAEKASFQNGIEVSEDAFFNDDVEIKGNAKLHYANISDCNLDYIDKKGTFSVSGYYYSNIQSPVTVNWAYRHWKKSNIVELWTKMPFLRLFNSNDEVSVSGDIKVFVLNRLAYPSEILFSNIPLEIATLNVNSNLSWLGVGCENEIASTNTTTESARYSIYSLSNSGCFDLVIDGISQPNTPYIMGDIYLHIIGDGTIQDNN